jgi:hypothetical protein
MCGPYWSQWDKADLDSWMGKDLIEENESCEDSEYDDQECSCLGCCSHNPCGNCMDCLGMSWRDFM